MENIETIYKNKVVPHFVKKKKMNVMEVPKIVKVVLNMGLGRAINEKNLIESAERSLMEIVGQKPIRTKAKKSLAGFKLREGMEIGLKVTLRGARMYDFLTRLIQIALPRVRDLRGVSKKSFDGQGNYTFGLKEHVIFPEVNYDKIDKIHGMDISIVTNTDKNENALELLSLLGMPFRK